jgi:hypothetical protein
VWRRVFDLAVRGQAESSLLAATVEEGRFSAAKGSALIMIPSGLQPARNLLFCFTFPGCGPPIPTYILLPYVYARRMRSQFL